MASTAEGLRLTTAHNAAQLRLRALFIRELAPLWASLDPDALDRSFGPWSVRAAELVRDMGADSAHTAAGYYDTFRSAETGLPTPGGLVVERDPNKLAEVIRRLRWPAVVIPKKHIAAGEPVELAMRMGLAETAREGSRQVLDGGTYTVIDTARQDPEALGYRRTCGGSACYFCALLASRGAVYKEDTATFRAHKGCGCGSEAVFTPDYWSHTPPNRAIDRAASTYDAAKGKGKERLTNFRRLYAEAMAD